MLKKKLPGGVRFLCFMGGLLLCFLVASLIPQLHWSVRFLITLPFSVLSGIGMYGLWPNKQNIESYKQYLIENEGYKEAGKVHLYDWILVVAFNVIVLSVLLQLGVTWLI